MISEAAVTGKPIYVAQMKPKRSNTRFENFYNEFKKLNVIRDLEDKIELWSYNQLNEVNRIAAEIKKNKRIWNCINLWKKEQNHLKILLNTLR